MIFEEVREDEILLLLLFLSLLLPLSWLIVCSILILGINCLLKD